MRPSRRSQISCIVDSYNATTGEIVLDELTSKVGMLSKTQRKRARAKASAARSRAPSGTQPIAIWLKRAVPFLTLALGLVAWWVIASLNNDEAKLEIDAPIATLDAPDFHSLLVDPRDADHILFGSHAGIQESRDGGKTWDQGNLRNVDAMSMATNTNAADTLYVAGHDVFQVSHDAGRTWQSLVHNLPGTDIHSFSQDPIDPKLLYAFVAGAGSFVSKDGGTAWEPLPTQPPGEGMQVVLASGVETLFAATGQGIHVSRNQGATWQLLSAQPTGQVISLAVPANDPQTVYVGSPSGIQLSIDGGATWVALGPEGVPVLAIALTPTNPGQIIFVSNDGDVFRSDDGGATWPS